MESTANEDTYFTVECRYKAVQYDISRTTAWTNREYKSEFKFTKDTPHLALVGKLWSVNCEDLEENWSRFNGTAIY